jgi:hypothetical protein
MCPKEYLYPAKRQKEKSISQDLRRKKDDHQKKVHTTKKIATKEPEVIDKDRFTLVTKKEAARGIPPIPQPQHANQDAPSDEDEDEDEDNDEGNKEEDQEKQQEREEQYDESSEALGITPTELESINAPREVYSAITSDPGVLSTFEEAFFGPMSHVWRPAIYEELMSFISRKAFKKSNTEQKQLFSVLIRFQSLFDGTFGHWQDETYDITLQDSAKPYHTRAYPIPKIHEATLKMEVKRLCKICPQNYQLL